MSHKVNPLSFRLHKMEDWRSRWFSKKNYAFLLREDFLIRQFIGKKLKDMGVEKVEIERSSGRVNVIISSARPGLIIGRGGAGIEELRKGLERKLFGPAGSVSKKKTQLKMEIREIKNPWESATLSAQWVVQQIERRMPFRRVLKQGIGKIMLNKGIQGAKIEISGRLDGAEIARREKLRVGRLPLQTIRADIDYAVEEAHTTYGVIGVKVWIYRGEKFE